MNHLLVGLVRADKPKSGWEPTSQGPGLFLGYRLASFLCQVRACWFHQGVVMVYPLALLEPESLEGKLLRFGIGLEGGMEKSLDPDKSWQHHQHAAGLLSMGLQYPWRVTPFLDFVVGLGVLHRNLYNKDFFDFAYSFGLDLGTSIFVVGRFHVTASVGWRRWAVRSDLGNLYVDSWSMTAGLGF